MHRIEICDAVYLMRFALPKSHYKNNGTSKEVDATSGFGRAYWFLFSQSTAIVSIVFILLVLIFKYLPSRLSSVKCFQKMFIIDYFSMQFVRMSAMKSGIFEEINPLLSSFNRVELHRSIFCRTVYFGRGYSTGRIMPKLFRLQLYLRHNSALDCQFSITIKI